MKILRTVLLLSALALALNGCGGTAPASDAPTSASLPELEDTNWLAVSADAAVFDLEDSLSNPNFEFVFNHTDTVPLDQLIAFALAADAASEGAYDELRSRFLEAPNTVLTYLLLLGDQPVEFWDNPPAAEVICQAIASADAAWHGGAEEFTQTLAACREVWPEGRATELLDLIEAEHAASLERNS